MNNYQGIASMDPAALELFLEQVYLSGVNFGLYLSSHPESDELYGKNPFTLQWLRQPAEPAICGIADCEPSNWLLSAFSRAILLQSGMTPEQITQIVRSALQDKRVFF